MICRNEMFAYNYIGGEHWFAYNNIISNWPPGSLTRRDGRVGQQLERHYLYCSRNLRRQTHAILAGSVIKVSRSCTLDTFVGCLHSAASGIDGRDDRNGVQQHLHPAGPQCIAQLLETMNAATARSMPSCWPWTLPFLPKLRR